MLPKIKIGAVIVAAFLIDTLTKSHFSDGIYLSTLFFIILVTVFVLMIPVSQEKAKIAQANQKNDLEEADQAADSELDDEGSNMMAMLKGVNAPAKKTVHTTYTKDVNSTNGNAHIRISNTKNPSGASVQTTDVAGQSVSNGQIHRTYQHNETITPQHRINKQSYYDQPHNARIVHDNRQYDNPQNIQYNSNNEQQGHWQHVRTHYDPQQDRYVHDKNPIVRPQNNVRDKY